MGREFREADAFVQDKGEIVAKDVDAGELLAVEGQRNVTKRAYVAMNFLTRFEVSFLREVSGLLDRL